jgi:glycosyltransferase involved in cell wall biosynthesis
MVGKKYDVDIVMVTYNHERYIEQAINSVISQKTNFGFRLIIGDDYSTDSTLSICEKYAKKFPDKILLLKSDSNIGLIQNYRNCFNKCTADYICILEGDDYWIDDMKIDKQACFLNKHENIALIHSNYAMYIEKKKKYKKTHKSLSSYCINNQGFIYEKLITSNFICPLTVMFRRYFLDQVDFLYLIDNEINTIDYVLWLNIALKSEIAYVNEVSGVYRISESSISNNSDFEKRIQFTDTRNKILYYFLNMYPASSLSITNIERNSNMRLLLRAIKTLNLKYIALYSKGISMPIIFDLIKRFFKFYR